MFVDTMTNKEYLSIANSPMLWAMVIPTVLAMCAQAYVFTKDLSLIHISEPTRH